MSVIEFPNAGPRRRALRRARAQNGQSMHTLLFRSRDLILKSDEADLVRDVCLDVDKAEKKLKAIRRRLQGVQEYAAAQVALLTAADTKLTAAIIVALLSAPSTPDTGRRCELMDILDGGGKERGQRQRKRSRPGSPRPSPPTARSGRSAQKLTSAWSRTSAIARSWHGLPVNSRSITTATCTTTLCTRPRKRWKSLWRTITP
jgi:hypothetical protein